MKYYWTQNKDKMIVEADLTLTQIAIKIGYPERAVRRRREILIKNGVRCNPLSADVVATHRINEKARSEVYLSQYVPED